MKKLLSIIIPSYNMEKYLARGLDSLIVKDELFSLLDIIVVNDGSKDRTSEIAHSYATRYPGIVSVIDKRNGNYGSCINAALQKVRGKYVKVLDADDTFTTVGFERLLSFLGSDGFDADLVITDYERVDENGKNLETIQYDDLPNGVVVPSVQITRGDADKMWLPAVCYKTRMFEGIDYHQTEGISYSDQEWIYSPMTNVSTVAHLPCIVYQYLIGRADQTVSSDNFFKNFWMTLQITLKICSEFERLKSRATSGGRQYLENRARRRVFLAYSLALNGEWARDGGNRERLTDFDGELNRISPALYAAADEFSASVFKFHYVREWRRQYSAETVRFKLFRFCASMKKRIRRFLP